MQCKKHTVECCLRSAPKPPCLPDIAPQPCPPRLFVQCKKHNVECSPPQTTARLLDKLVGEFIESQASG